MAKRGPRPHPGFLTPREEEVLALLRQKLTNPEIAERLGITLDGAKYHVSEILSKLGVSSREEAARWQPEGEARRWWATAFAPMAMLWRKSIAAVPFGTSTAALALSGVLLVATLSGLGLIAFLLARGDGGSAGEAAVVVEPTPVVATASPTPATAGGVLYSDDAGLTWQASDLTGKWVTSIYRDPATVGRALVCAATPTGIEVYETTDGGATWSLQGRLPEEAGTWPWEILAVRLDGELKLLVASPHGFWLSEDNGAGWDPVQGTPEHAPRWLASVLDGDTTHVFISVTGQEDVPEKGVYGSTDLMTWRKVASGNFRFSESFDRQAVLATDETGMPLEGVLLTADGQETIPLPLRASEAVGAFDGSAPFIVEAIGMRRSVDGGGSWSVGDVRVYGDFAAAPDFPSSGVAVFGGFRTGIFRSADAGLTWDLVLAKPSSVVAGSGDFGAVVFLSPTDVVAANGGGRHWPYDECDPNKPVAGCWTPSPP